MIMCIVAANNINFTIAVGLIKRPLAGVRLSHVQQREVRDTEHSMLIIV